MNKFLLITLLSIAAPVMAADKSGVSPTKLVLPKGPGSLEGIGSNAEPNLSMGLVSYSVSLQIPQGQHGLTPQLSLAYNSGAGSDVVGMGWSLQVSSIERMTSRGLPRYQTSDLFAANGGEELVPVGGGYYRARFEKSFVRYRWVDNAATGQNGYWMAEYPDGRVGYFGATYQGAVVSSACVQNSNKTFRYHLVDMVDTLGHRIHYTYVKDGASSLVSRVEWVNSGAGYRYRIEINYETRPDELSTGRPGYDVRISQRVKTIAMFARDNLLRRYELTYESELVSGGLSRMSQVVMRGQDGATAHPVVFSFEYTDVEAAVPYVHTMGSLGVDFRGGNAELIDITGDGLPDALDTSHPTHLFHLNNLGLAGSHAFYAPAESHVARGGSLLLASPKVELVDLNGDGFSDMLDAANDVILWNNGQGDWASQSSTDLHLPSDFGNNANLKFFDYDGDKRPDLLMSLEDATWIYRNLDGSHFATQAELVDSIGVAFTQGLQLADMNGDGMPDATQYLGDGLVRYRLNLGWGKFSAWQEMFGLPSDLLAEELQFVDIDGDSLSDAVSVVADEVLVYRNRNGAEFESVESLATPAVGSIPERTSDVSVRFADMNGSGSTDVVWINASGQLTYLELFPERANLLRSVSNGLGKKIALSYSSSVNHLARDGGIWAWSDRLPQPVLTLDRIEVSLATIGVVQIQNFAYHNGYYDGAEKQFSGFNQVETSTAGDVSVAAGLTASVFDTGKADFYRRGLLLEQSSLSAGIALHKQVHSYSDCTVSEAAPRVRSVCETAVDTIVQEGRPQAEWVTTREEYTYDGYGNRIKHAQLGTVQKSGDERFEETSYVSPAHAGGRWLINQPYGKRSYSVAGGRVAEERTYYDNRDLGELTQGLIRQVSHKLDDNRYIASQRFKYDAHGNVIEVLDANDHKRSFAYDSDGVLPTRETAHFATHTLGMEISYDSVNDLPVASSDWRYNDGDAPLTLYRYDTLGRITGIARPGDSIGQPTEEYTYELASPTSRIVTRRRSQQGGVLDTESAQCFDGLGRKLHDVTKLDSTHYQIIDLTRYNALAKAWRIGQKFIRSTGTCLIGIPADVLYTENLYDAEGRLIETRHADADLYGARSFQRMTYGPLWEMHYDEEDTHLQGVYASTPTITYKDGLARTTAVTRMMNRGAPAMTVRFAYDDLGNLAQLIDAGGYVRTQENDLLGRAVHVQDPDSGSLSMSYDDAGNMLSRTDARGSSTAFAYDEANRRVAQWDVAKSVDSKITWVYDVCAGGTHCAGRLAQVETSVVEDKFSYDARGQISDFSRAVSGVEFALHSTYDNLGRVTATEYPGERVVAYHYDAAGRLLDVPGYVSDVDYDARGLMSKIDMANGVSTEQTYDSRVRLSAVSTRLSGNTVLRAAQYAYDRVGNIATIQDDTTAAYSYDAAYRLASAILNGARPSAETLSYAYDQLDNIVRKESSLGAQSAEHVGELSYGQGAGPHAVTRAGTLAIAYDAAGNMRILGQKKFLWNHLGQLTQILHGAKIVGAYDYDASGERVRKVEGASTAYYVTPDYEVRDGVSTFYVRVAGQRVAKIETVDLAGDLLPDATDDGVIDAQDAWIAGQAGGDAALVDSMLQASARRLVAILDVAGVTYLHPNYLGSATLTTDEAGEVVARAEYFPYGSTRASEGGVEDYSWAGQETDASGLSYHSARYLVKSLGRFASLDPLFSEIDQVSIDKPWEAANRYSYAGNDPVNNTDATGQVIDTFIDAAFIAYDVVAAVYHAAQNDTSAMTSDLAALAADSICLAIPGATGGGIAARSAEHAGEQLLHAGTKKATQAAVKAEQAAVHESSRAARREAMRQAGTPTSRPLTSQSGKEGRRQTVTQGADGKPRVQTQHPADKDHSKPHWHDAKPKLDNRGNMRSNSHGQIKYESSDSKAAQYGNSK